MILPSMFLLIEKVAQAFFTLKKQDGWATCPLTENAFLRILGHPSYPKGPGSPSAARTLLQEFICQPEVVHRVSWANVPGENTGDTEFPFASAW